MFESHLGTNCFCMTRLGRGAIGAFLGACFKIQERRGTERDGGKKNLQGI